MKFFLAGNKDILWCSTGLFIISDLFQCLLQTLFGHHKKERPQVPKWWGWHTALLQNWFHQCWYCSIKLSVWNMCLDGKQSVEDEHGEGKVNYFGNARNNFPIHLWPTSFGICPDLAKVVCNLGIMLDTKLNTRTQVNQLVKSCSYHTQLLQNMYTFVPTDCRKSAL